MVQPTLFDAMPPAARASDPHTSHQAAASARLRAETQLGRLLAVYAAETPAQALTDEMAATLAGAATCATWN